MDGKLLCKVIQGIERAARVEAFLILAVTLELVSFIYLSFLIVSGSLVTRFVGSRKNLVKLGNSLIGLVFVGFAARLASLQS